MFLLIPLLSILISIFGIAVIVWRKRSYLSKLHTINSAGSGDGSAVNFSWLGYGGEFFPEIKAITDRMAISKYKSHWLIETEKFLRKARLMFLRIDRMSDVMIKKIRKIHTNEKLNGPSLMTAEQSLKEEIPKAIKEEKGTISLSFLKNEEERLIIEIAKNPKDNKLYEELGDVYIEMGNFADAKESYEAAMELNSKNEPLRQKLSAALERIAQA